MISQTKKQEATPPRCALLAKDPVYAGPMVDSAAARGVALDACVDTEDLLEALASADYRVIAVRLDLEAADTAAELALIELIARVRTLAPDATVIGLGCTGTTTERTAAGRIGVDLYVQKGDETEFVIDTWERLLRSRFHAVLLDIDSEYVRPLEEAAEPLNCELTALDDSLRLFDELGRLEPDLLVLRKRSVGYNAIELLRALRVSERFAALPVLVVTDRRDTEFELRSYQAGADGVLAVPTPMELRARMRAILSRSTGRCGEQGEPGAETDLGQTLGDVPSVIVVEDDPSLLEMLEYSLGNRGHRIDLHTDGRKALTALLELETGGRRPVVLLDVDLPGLDGFGVLREISRLRPGQFQIIITTVHSSDAAQVLALQTGAIDYIVKPVRMPVVLAKVQRLLESAGMA